MPAGVIENQLVQFLADSAWRLNRIPAYETNILALEFHAQKDAINTSDERIHAALTMAHAMEKHTKSIANMSLHEHRLQRKYERTLQQLRELQAERREQEKEQMKQAASLLILNQERDLPYDPKEDGFVFTVAEIDAHIARKQRLDAAWKHRSAA